MLLTDMVGYTALTRRDGPLALELLEESRAVIRAQLHAHGGCEVKTIGDAVLAEFERADDAVGSAIAIQQNLQVRNTKAPPSHAVHLRIGVHLDTIVHRDGDVYGDGVNIVSRVEPMARPGQVCITEPVRLALERKPSTPMMPLGPRSLRGLTEPMELYELVCSEGPGRAPPAAGGGDSRPSIAVLPLMNLSSEPENEFFSDGMTEELIGALSRSKGLRVISRTSAFSLKGKELGVRAIGELLNVDTVLEGSVRRFGDRVRISVQLIDTHEDTPRWSERYDREIRDVFTIQEEIAQAIAETLEVTLRAGPRRPLTANTDDLEAYTFYLKGRFYWNQRTEKGLHQAISCFERAIRRNPDYALAYSGLADAFTVLPDYTTFNREEAYRRSVAAARRALQLDEGLAEAHASMADIKLLYEWDWIGAEEDLQRAIRLSPGYTTAYHWYGHCLLYTGRFEEAGVWFEQALDMDPLSVIVHSNLGLALYAAGHRQRALAALERALEIAPDFGIAQLYLGLLHIALGRMPDARTAFGEARRNLGHNTAPADVGLTLVDMMTGNITDGRARLEQVELRAARGGAPPTWVALVYAGLGSTDDAFAWLQRALGERDNMLRFLRVLHPFDTLKGDARYTELLRELRLPLLAGDTHAAPR